MATRINFYQVLDAIDGLNLQHSMEIIESWRNNTSRPSEHKLRIAKILLLHKLGWSLVDFNEEFEGLRRAVVADLMEYSNENNSQKAS